MRKKIYKFIVKILGESISSRLIVIYHRLEGEHVYKVEVQKKVKIEFWGSKMDGGFAVAKDMLTKKPIIISFGIGENLTFSMAAHEKTDCEIYAFDPTPSAVEYVNRSELIQSERMHFFPIGLSNHDGEEQFYLPIDSDKVDKSASIFYHSKTKNETISVPVKKMTSIIELISKYEKELSVIDIVKMDIEGTEFLVLEDIVKQTAVQIKQICVEVHPRFFEDGQKELDQLIDMMNREKYYVVYVSPDHCVLTFVRL